MKMRTWRWDGAQFMNDGAVHKLRKSHLRLKWTDEIGQKYLGELLAGDVPLGQQPSADYENDQHDLLHHLHLQLLLVSDLFVFNQSSFPIISVLQGVSSIFVSFKTHETTIWNHVCMLVMKKRELESFLRTEDLKASYLTKKKSWWFFFRYNLPINTQLNIRQMKGWNVRNRKLRRLERSLLPRREVLTLVGSMPYFKGVQKRKRKFSCILFISHTISLLLCPESF